MKKRRFCFVLTLFSFLALVLLCCCETREEKVQLEYDTGYGMIEIDYLLPKGYSFVLPSSKPERNDFDVANEKNEIVFRGRFVSKAVYLQDLKGIQEYSNEPADENRNQIYILKEYQKDNNAYFFFSNHVPYVDTTQYTYYVDITESSDIAFQGYSEVSQSEAEKIMASFSFVFLREREES